MKKEVKKGTSRKELLRLLAAAVDGINGYESETGRLRYWKERAVEEARVILKQEGVPSAI